MPSARCSCCWPCRQWCGGTAVSCRPAHSAAPSWPSWGWSRRRDPHDHAEESAVADLGPGWRAPPGTTVYSSLEPCSARSSRPRTCTELILAAGVDRVVFAWREPGVFVDGEGAELLRAGGVDVVELPELADAAREPNAHLLGAR